MTVERASLSASLSLERLAPAPSAPSVQGHSSPEDEDREGKPRRPPPQEKSAAEPSAEPSNGENEEIDPPAHRIDSLA
jgi:hypothetical protein